MGGKVSDMNAVWMGKHQDRRKRTSGIWLNLPLSIGLWSCWTERFKKETEQRWILWLQKKTALDTFCNCKRLWEKYRDCNSLTSSWFWKSVWGSQMPIMVTHNTAWKSAASSRYQLACHSLAWGPQQPFNMAPRASAGPFVLNSKTSLHELFLNHGGPRPQLPYTELSVNVHPPLAWITVTPWIKWARRSANHWFFQCPILWAVREPQCNYW